jgi:two-component system sensor histidine kinase KdpD
MAIIGGSLASRLRAQLAGLRATNDQSQMLLMLNKKLAEAPDPNAVQRTTVQVIANFQHVPVCPLSVESASDRLEIAAAAPGSTVLTDIERAAAWAFQHARPSGHQSDTLPSVGWRFLPLNLDESAMAFLVSSCPRYRMTHRQNNSCCWMHLRNR